MRAGRKGRVNRKNRVRLGRGRFNVMNRRWGRDNRKKRR